MSKAKKTNLPERSYRSWSPNRPTVPDNDDLFTKIMKEAHRQPNTIWGHADKTGLSTSTINNHLKGKVKHPKSVSLQMWAASLGMKIIVVKRS